MADPAGIDPALSAFVRAEFESPVAGLRGLIDILAEDAAKAGLSDYADDLDRMRRAGERLSGLVSGLLDGAGAPADEGARSKLRHDLRTPVSSILGYGELLAEEARDGGDTGLFSPLADVLEAAGRLLKELDKLVAFSGAVGTGPAPEGPLPDVLRQAVAVAEQLSRREPSAARSVLGRLLVVDDNAAMRDLVSRRLEREGHAVTVCNSGRAALRLAGEGDFDLMLLDLMMPGMTGLEVLDHLRSEPSTQDLPVIVISALDEIDAAVRCIEAGADDFLSKPLNETLLRARISSSLDRKFLRDRERDAAARLRAEQERSDALLHNVLPSSVVERLAAGETVIADHFDDVSVLFCDLVGFTALSAELSPAGTLDLLNDIFSGFDRLAEENGLEKIKTIGDAYMVVGGISPPVEGHVTRLVRMACGMPGIVRAVAPERDLTVRIGIDTGPAVAGIVGRKKFFYDVWGDTVNTASRLEASAESGRVHVSDAVRCALGGDIVCETRPPIHLKGKGELRTFYVTGPRT